MAGGESLFYYSSHMVIRDWCGTGVWLTVLSNFRGVFISKFVILPRIRYVYMNVASTRDPLNDNSSFDKVS